MNGKMDHKDEEDKEDEEEVKLDEPTQMFESHSFEYVMDENEIELHERNKPPKRRAALKKYMSSVGNKSANKPTADIMKLAMAETKNRLGQGLLQFHEVGDDEDNYLEDLEYFDNIPGILQVNETNKDSSSPGYFKTHLNDANQQRSSAKLTNTENTNSSYSSDFDLESLEDSKSTLSGIGAAYTQQNNRFQSSNLSSASASISSVENMIEIEVNPTDPITHSIYASKENFPPMGGFSRVSNKTKQRQPTKTSRYNAFTPKPKNISKSRPKSNSSSTSPGLNKLFGSKKVQDDNSKHFKQFEEDFFRIMEHDDEKQWKSAVQPTPPKTNSQQKNSSTKPKIDVIKPNIKSAGNGQSEKSTTDHRNKGSISLPFHFPKEYFSTLPYRKSKKKKKSLDVFSEGSKDDYAVPDARKSTYTPAFSPRKPEVSPDKSGGLGQTIKAAFRPPNKTIDNDLLMQIFDQEKEQQWKSVVLSKEQKDKMKEEREMKEKSIEKKKRKEEEERQRREEEAMAIKMIEEAESNAHDLNTSDTIELTVEGAFVVKSETDGSSDDVSSISSSTPLRHVTERFSSLRRTRSDKVLQSVAKAPLRRQVTLDANMDESGTSRTTSPLIRVKSKTARTSSLQNTIETYRNKFKGSMKRNRSNSTSDNELDREKTLVKRNHSLEQIRAARHIEQQKELDKMQDRNRTMIERGKLWKKASMMLLKNRSSKDNRANRSSTSSKDSESSQDNVTDQDFNSYWWRTSNSSLTDEQVQLRRRHESNLLHPLWFKTIGYANKSTSNTLSHIEEMPNDLRQRKNLFRRSRSWGTLMDSLEQHCYEIDDSLDQPSNDSTDQDREAAHTKPLSTDTENDVTNYMTKVETKQLEAARNTNTSQQTLLYRNMDESQGTEKSSLDSTKHSETEAKGSMKKKTMISRFEITIGPSQTKDINKESSTTVTSRSEKTRLRRAWETKPMRPSTICSEDSSSNQSPSSYNDPRDISYQNSQKDWEDSSAIVASNRAVGYASSNTTVHKNIGNLVIEPSANMGKGMAIDHIPFMLEMAEEKSPTYTSFNEMETVLAQNAAKIGKSPSNNRQTVTMALNPGIKTEKKDSTARVTKSKSMQVTTFNLAAPKRSKSVTEPKRARKISIIRLQRRKSEIVNPVYQESEKQQNPTNESRLYLDLNATTKLNKEDQPTCKLNQSSKTVDSERRDADEANSKTSAETKLNRVATTTSEPRATNTQEIRNHNIQENNDRHTNGLETRLNVPDGIMPTKQINYRKVMEIRHGRSTLTVPYIAVGKIEDSESEDMRKIYTSDSNAECMRAYSLEGNHKFSIAVPGCPRGLTSFTPSHVLCTSCTDGHVYVIDTVRGNILRQIGQKGTLHNPRYVAMHHNNRAFVTTDIRSLGKWKINMFDLRTGFATFSLAPSNHPDINIQWPGFLTFRPASDQLYVSDSESNCLFVYDVRRSARPVFQFGKKGHGEGELLNPCGVAYLDGGPQSGGMIVVSDWGNNRVSAFDPITGRFQGHVIGGTKEFVETPYDISSDENGCIYLTESETNYIKLFKPVFE